MNFAVIEMTEIRACFWQISSSRLDVGSVVQAGQGVASVEMREAFDDLSAFDGRRRMGVPPYMERGVIMRSTLRIREQHLIKFPRASLRSASCFDELKHNILRVVGYYSPRGASPSGERQW
jgi:hypothetical protein